MNDKFGGWLAIFAGILSTLIAGGISLLQLRGQRVDKAAERENKERADLMGEGAKLRAEAWQNAERHQKALQEAESKIREVEAEKRLWERRCRVMDDWAHDWRHRAANAETIADSYAIKAGLPPHEWPTAEPLPKLEDI